MKLPATVKLCIVYAIWPIVPLFSIAEEAVRAWQNLYLRRQIKDDYRSWRESADFCWRQYRGVDEEAYQREKALESMRRRM